MIGSRLGHYEIVSLLGEGGMGEVYRATDTRLNRDVAVKVLPTTLASDADRTARFKREAQVLASLNHPNVAAIYGLEEASSDGAIVRALVMELVEGDTLTDRLAKGALPLDDVIAIARQLAEAIEYAHEQGVIHRDLKPANIKITPSGSVKVLDFGLAKALDTAAVKRPPSPAFGATEPEDGNANSPTLSLAMTQAGLILGTAAYMSPEQAKGKPADRRADIWGFGIVVFEMLTGRSVYSGETVSETMAHVITKEPDWTALPATTPPRLRELLRRCLVKDPRRRLQAIGEARIALDDVGGSESIISTAATSATYSGPTRRSRREWIWASLAVLGFLASGFMSVRDRFAPPLEIHAVHFAVTTPELGMPPFPQGQAVLSPDGRKLAFLGMSGAKQALWVHNLDSGNVAPLENTEGIVPAIVMWSPDSRYIAFSTAGRLRKIAASGGPSQAICALPDRIVTAAWGADDVILLAGDGLFRVSGGGGEVMAIAVGDPKQEFSILFPSFLPDGRHYLYLGGARSALVAYVGSLDGTDPRPLPGIASEVKYSSGHVLFLRDGALMAQPFDLTRFEISGDAFPLAARIAPPGAIAGPFSVSANGSVAYRAGSGPRESQLMWFDRMGKPLGTASAIGRYNDIELSLDEKLVAYESATGGLSSSDTGDIFVLDLERAVVSHVTTDPARDADPVWSPDGKKIVFRSDRDGGHLYERAFGMVGEDHLLLKTNRRESPDYWSVDGRYITYQSNGDLWALPTFGDRQPIQITNSPANDEEGRISPDGKWIAYQSGEAGTSEVFIQSFPEARVKQQVSAGGGSMPRWSADGRELFYLSPTSPDLTLTVATVKSTGDSLSVGAPQRLFPLRIPSGEGQYAVSKTGRLLANVNVNNRATPAITVVLNWAAGTAR